MTVPITVKAGDYPIGALYAVIEQGALCALEFDSPEIASRCVPIERLDAEDKAAFEPVCRWLKSYFEGKLLPLDGLRLSLRGTPFQERVWEELKAIPEGKTVSYGQIAGRLEANCGKRVSAQAVGGAVGRNPFPLLLPCHRVIGANGSLVGYGGGLDRKLWLLEHEGFTVKDGRVLNR